MIGIGTLGSLGLNGGILYDAAASAFFARLTNQPTSARATLYNNLFISLRSNGILPLLDALYITAAADAQAAGQNLVQNAYNLTAVNAPVFTADRGYKGDGTAAYLNTNLAVNGAGLKFQQNSAHLAVYQRQSTAAASLAMGIRNPTTYYAHLAPNYTGGVFWSALNEYPDHNVSDPNAGLGMYAITRNNASQTQAFARDVKVSTTAGTSVAPPNSVMYLLASDDAGVAAGFSSAQITMASIGGGLSDTQEAQLYAAIQTYMTGVGANV